MKHLISPLDLSVSELEEILNLGKRQANIHLYVKEKN